MKRRGFMKLLAALVPATQLKVYAAEHPSELLADEPKVEEFEQWAETHVLPPEKGVGAWISLDGEVYVYVGDQVEITQTKDIERVSWDWGTKVANVAGCKSYSFHVTDNFCESQERLNTGEKVYWFTNLGNGFKYSGQGFIASIEMSSSIEEYPTRQLLITGSGELNAELITDQSGEVVQRIPA